MASDRTRYLAFLRDCSDWIVCGIFWKLRSYLTSKIENHVFGPFLEGRALRYSWHSRSHDAVIRMYDDRMVMPLSGDYGCHIVDAGEVFAGISDLQALETRLASIN